MHRTIYTYAGTAHGNSPPIPIRALQIANGNFVNIPLSGKDKSKNLVCAAILSTLGLGNTRPLQWHSSTESISARNKFVLACLHPPRSPTREAVCRSSGKNQARRLPGVHPEYNATASGRRSNGLTRHPLSAALTLQQCLFGNTKERYHQPIDRSPVHSEAWAKENTEVSLGHQSPPYGRSVGTGNAKDPQNTIFLLTGRRTRQACGLANQRC
ncbi:hypothetical protein TNCV_1428701 [Trichonephila clavipes]|nr:hypothetical protein TNCV_1428701 [Trichonephila clavipes]